MKLFLGLCLSFLRRKNSKWPNFSAWVSMLGVAFGVIAFLTVVTILDAFQTQMKQTISSVNPNLTIFSPMGIDNLQKNEKKIISLIGSEIQTISPFIYQESILVNKKRTSGVYIRAIDGIKSSSVDNLKQFILPKTSLSELGDRFNLKDKSSIKVILGKELANKLNVDLHSNLFLMTFEKQKNRSPRIDYLKLEVVGFLEVGLIQYDEQYMIMNFSDAQKIFGHPNWASGFEIKLYDSNKALSLSDLLSQKTPYSTMAWQEIDSGLFRQISRDSTVIKFIVLIISLVATFNILVTLGLTVVDRSKQISLLRCLGAQKKHIILTFVSVGGILGFFGALLGIMLSILILYFLSEISLGDLNQFYYLSKIPVTFNIHLIILVFVVAILLSALGALYPAWRASKIAPISGINAN